MVMGAEMSTVAKQEEDHVSTYKGLRKMVGAIGLALPVALILYSWFFLDNINDSISAYYYEPLAGTLFVGALWAIGIFLGSYRGYVPTDEEWISDRKMGLIACFSAISLTVFPTNGFGGLECSQTVVHYVHLVSAGVFLLTLAAFSFFKFTRSATPPDQQPKDKRLRNKIFKTCGLLTFGAILLIFILTVYEKATGTSIQFTGWVFWLETIAVWSFGFSWLVKGEALNYPIKHLTA